MLAAASLPEWNDLDRLARHEGQCCFVAARAARPALPLRLALDPEQKCGQAGTTLPRCLGLRGSSHLKHMVLTAQ
jgi:hypothetical protein